LRAGSTLNVSGLNNTFRLDSGQTLSNSDATVVGPVVVENDARVEGKGTFVGDLSVRSGGVIQIGSAAALVGTPVGSGGDAVTYIDAEIPTVATVGNTNVVDVSAFPAVGDWVELSGVNNNATSSDDKWLARPDSGVFGNNGKLFTADDRGNENAPLIATTITSADGLVAGNEYSVFAYFWSNDPNNWSLRATVDASDVVAGAIIDNPGITSFSETTASQASIQTFTNSPLLDEGGTRDLYVANLGTAVADGSGNIVVFIDDEISNGSSNRAWYDGVGWAEVSTASTEFADNINALNVQGDLTLDIGSTLAIDIFAENVLDRLVVTDLLTAGGTLDVDFVVGSPDLAAGDVFDILDFGSIAGAFDAFDLPLLATGLAWDTSGLLTMGTLEVIDFVGIPGDFNADGWVDAADFTVWRDNFGADESLLPAGSSDNSGTIDAADYDLWSLNFGNSIASSNAIVPEPSVWVSFAAIACGLIAMRRRN